VLDILTDPLGFISNLFTVIRAALRLQPDLLATVRALPHPSTLATTVALLAGASLLLGQSVVLFANGVSRGRFLLSLAFNGIMFTLDIGLWSLTAWGIATSWFGVDVPLSTVLMIVFLGTAPLLFSFLMVLPYLGTPIGWALQIWAFLTILITVDTSLPLTIWEALLCTILGWVLIEIINRAFGRPLAVFRDWLWRVVTRSRFEQNTQGLVDEVIDQLNAQLAARSQTPAAPNGKGLPP
jgi:hypothetical protein